VVESLPSSPFYLSDRLAVWQLARNTKSQITFLPHNPFLNLAEWLAAYSKISQITIPNKNKNYGKTPSASCQASHTAKPYY
jgi:hypothetical protein